MVDDWTYKEPDPNEYLEGVIFCLRREGLTELASILERACQCFH